MNENEFENVNPEEAEAEEIINEEAAPVEEVPEETVSEGDASQTVEITETYWDIGEEPVSNDENGEAASDSEDNLSEDFVIPKKKSKLWKIILIIIVVIALIFGGLFLVFGSPLYNKLGLDKSEYGSFPDLMHCTFEQMKNRSSNKYNNIGYANPSGKTIDEISEDLGISLEEFLETYNLPEDMPGDTEEMAAYYTMPVKVFAQMYGIDFATLKEAYSIPDETTPDIPKTIGDKLASIFGKGKKTEEITEDTAWGKVLDEMTLATYVGEDNLEQFKEFYGITADITGETRYKEVRRAVEESQMKLAAEAAQAEADAESENGEADDASADDVQDTGAEADNAADGDGEAAE